VPSLRFESSLTPGLLRREGLQLAMVAALTAVPLFLDSRVLGVVAGIVDIGVAVVSAIALAVAWRVSRGNAVVLYGAAVIVFAALAVLNLRG
jgi:hypothetical protein